MILTKARFFRGYDIWEGDYEDHARSRLKANDQRDKYASFSES